MFTINLKELVHCIREIAAENPDYVYPDHYTHCVYNNGDGYGCLVGMGLKRLNPSFYEYVSVNYNKLPFSVILAISITSEWTFEDYKPEFTSWIVNIQNLQDSITNRLSWKKCVEVADQEKEKY